MALADYDGDGRDELWVGMAGSGRYMYIAYKRGMPCWLRRAYWVMLNKYHSDLDGDGFAGCCLRTAEALLHILRRPEGLVS